MKIGALVLAIGCGIACIAVAAQPTPWPPPPGHTTLNLWPGAAPGAKPNQPGEANLASDKDGTTGGRKVYILGNVSGPSLTIFAPKQHASGSNPAVVVFPGGGYQILATDLEGTEVCDWLNSINVTCVLAKYRVPDSGPYPQYTAALQDAQRAVSLVRAYAKEWGIDPGRVGVLGFSAGGNLAAQVSMHYEQRLYNPVDDADKLSCRPDFSVLIYPAYIANEEKNYTPSAQVSVNAKTPPAFILMTEDDPVHVENAILYFQLLKAAKVPAELHLFAEGGHGYGLRPTDKPVTKWPALAETWLHTIKVLR